MEIKEVLEKVQAEVKGAIAPLLEDVKKSIVDAVKPVSDEVASLKSKVEAIEKLPLPTGMPAVVRSDVYKGFKLSKQAVSFRKNLDILGRKEEEVDDMCKFFLDFVKAHGKAQNAEAKQALHEFYQKSALAEGADATGGYLVPEQFYADIVRMNRGKSFLLSNAKIIEMATDTMNIPGELTLVSTAWTNEGTAATETEPTYTTVQLVAKKMDGYGIMSNELLEDAQFDVIGHLTEQFGTAIALELDNQSLNGTGAPCSGVLTAAAGYSVVMATGSSNFSTISADNLSNMIAKIDEDFIGGSMFVFNKLIKHYIRTLKDTTNNYVYAAPGGVVPGTIWEMPYFESVKAPSSTGASTAFVTLGNFKYFYLGRKMGGMSLRIDPYGKFKENQTQFGVFSRWAPKIAQSKAFCRLITAA